MKIKIVMFLSLVIFSCKNEAPKSSNNEAGYAKTEAEYNKNPSDSLFIKLIQEVGKSIIDAPNKKDKEATILHGIDLIESANKSEFATIFYTELIKVNPENPRAKQILYDLAESMRSIKKLEVASILFAGFTEQYPNDTLTKQARLYVFPIFSDKDKYMKIMATKVFENPDANGINRTFALLYIDICEAYALAFPKDPKSPEYLFKASEIARGLASFPKTMSLYDWIYNYFPQHKNASTSLFMKGFMLENEFGKKDDARKAYQLFLEKYPQDSLAKDATFLLENLDKSNEEILKKMGK